MSIKDLAFPINEIPLKFVLIVEQSVRLRDDAVQWSHLNFVMTCYYLIINPFLYFIDN